jgi:hypothetical protein
VHFETAAESKFVRVHPEGNPKGSWVVREGEIRGLTPIEIRDKLNLPQVPTHITEVHVPPGTKMTRGITNFNEWEGYTAVERLEGQVQYRIEQHLTQDSVFVNTRPIGEVLR